jgi:hypothetical protein
MTDAMTAIRADVATNVEGVDPSNSGSGSQRISMRRRQRRDRNHPLRLAGVRC